MGKKWRKKAGKGATSSIEGGKSNEKKPVNFVLLHRELDRLMTETQLFLNQLKEHHNTVMKELEGD